ncbi:hypothetical protein DICPUDRAFT_54304 [Dictyostelium purpureum]|uniref:D-lactate dehydrogenase n=1 Tax=Dictyostelium purpureum TaxID=5786 RepID=F0ZGG9_DICPU|nr:uncharacterized protein DICPUDRAFT_54304 [Dictyostelium purpureum]EGC36955.1 hypothetical protein DICPUDRAFT_54304 [Dictyostelium purpureum]|eukprot:XP_003286523.1 hypothetical protein DICPUDRAFT_54304 [Dictyostelium purpureum]
MKICLFSSKPYWVKWFGEVNNYYQIEFFTQSLNINTVKETKGAQAVCCFVNDDLNKDVIEKLSENGVKVILMRCAGFNKVDLEAANKCGISVLRVPTYSPNAVSEYALSLMLTLNRKTHKAYHRVKEGNFEINGLEGFNMSNRVFGIIGTGNIGYQLIRVLRLGFNAKVLAYDIFENKDCIDIGVEYVKTLDEIWAQSDIISLHTPLTPKTKYMVCEETLSKMKDGVMIINVSRGALVNTKDAINGLKTGKIGYLGMDVYEHEEDYFFQDHSDQIIKDDDLQLLVSFPNVIISSHQAWYTKEAISSICKTTVQNLFDYEKGEVKKSNLVNNPQ